MTNYTLHRCAALDKMGDKSSEEQRRECFMTVDRNLLDGIDFGEYVEVSNPLHCTIHIIMWLCAYSLCRKCREGKLRGT